MNQVEQTDQQPLPNGLIRNSWEPSDQHRTGGYEAQKPLPNGLIRGTGLLDGDE